MEVQKKLNHSQELRKTIQKTLKPDSKNLKRNKAGNYERKLNFKSSISEVDNIPTLCPNEIMDEWLKDDPEPFYVYQEFDLPQLSNGYLYGHKFFTSFITHLLDSPAPGSRIGHNMIDPGKTPNTDLLLVGGKIKGNKAYFKNYILPIGESGSNEILKKSLKSGMASFSLVAYTKDEWNENQQAWECIESLDVGRRNDIVEAPGMKSQLSM